jgi:hypothetical protein
MDTKYILKSDGLLVVDRGAWVSGENYDAGNLTQNSGSFICTVDHLSAAGTEPGVGASWATVWKALQVITGTYQSAYFKAEDAAPYYRLKVDAAHDMLIRPNGDLIEFYDNAGAACRASINIHTGVVALTGALAIPAGISTPVTDHQLGLDITAGTSTLASTGAISGTWTVSEGASDNVQIVTRTAAASDVYYRIKIRGLPKRTAANKGAKIKSITVSYVAGGTLDTTNDAIQAMIIKQLVPTNGNAASASILAGDADADYDTDHDTNAERVEAGNQTMTVTIPVGEQAYAIDNEDFAVRIRVKDAATANLTFVLTGALVNYETAEY